MGQEIWIHLLNLDVSLVYFHPSCLSFLLAKSSLFLSCHSGDFSLSDRSKSLAFSVSVFKSLSPSSGFSILWSFSDSNYKQIIPYWPLLEFCFNQSIHFTFYSTKKCVYTELCYVLDSITCTHFFKTIWDLWNISWKHIFWVWTYVVSSS